MKWRQLSLFSDKEVERSPLCRVFFNPKRRVIVLFRFEVLYKIENPGNRNMDSLITWNVMRHIKGAGATKVGSRYFYDTKKIKTNE